MAWSSRGGYDNVGLVGDEEDLADLSAALDDAMILTVSTRCVFAVAVVVVEFRGEEFLPP